MLLPTRHRERLVVDNRRWVQPLSREACVGLIILAPRLTGLRAWPKAHSN